MKLRFSDNILISDDIKSYAQRVADLFPDEQLSTAQITGKETRTYKIAENLLPTRLLIEWLRDCRIRMVFDLERYGLFDTTTRSAIKQLVALNQSDNGEYNG